MNRVLKPLCAMVLAVFSGSLMAADATDSHPAAENPVTGEGLFVAVGYGGFRGWSLNGETWTAERWSDKNGDDVNIICGLTYHAGVFVCSGGGTGKGFILRSTDGKHWDEVVKTRWRIQPVAALDDGFIAVFDDHFQLSKDGLTWKQAAEAKPLLHDVGPGWHSGYFRHFALGKGVMVLGGDYALPGGVPRVGWIGSTKNGETALVSQRLAADVIGIAFGNDRFVASAKDGTILTSTDGLQFKQIDSLGDKRINNSLCFRDGLFYLKGNKGCETSSDGEHWTALPKPLRIPQAVSPSGIAVDCGWGGIEVATDGKTFHKARVTVDATGVGAVIYGVPLANLPKEESRK